MKIVLIAAVSKDGYIATKSHINPYSWTSKEDKLFFSEQLSKHSLHIMGRKTYHISAPKIDDSKTRVVLTNQPSKYQSVPGKLHFESSNPEEIIEQYKKTHSSALVLGGAEVYTTFINANLVDEIILTVEPTLFRKGTPLFLDENDIDTFIRRAYLAKKLNSNGTMLYRIRLKN